MGDSLDAERWAHVVAVSQSARRGVFDLLGGGRLVQRNVVLLLLLLLLLQPLLLLLLLLLLLVNRGPVQPDATRATG